MDKDLIEQMALASGLEYKKLDDGTMGFRPYIFNFAKAIEKRVTDSLQAQITKDQYALVALRSEVAVLASENTRLRRLVIGAREILDKENGCE